MGDKQLVEPRHGSGERSHLFNFTGISANKAGMGADRKLVADFVYQKSKNSQYTQHQLDLDAKQKARAEAVAAEIRVTESRMSEIELASEKRKMELALGELEKHRDLSRTHCVVDMDMFYAAVEIRDQPDLATKPVAIGGLGMICTANYVARLYGVRSAMPGFIAVDMVRNPSLVGSKMPPDELVFIPPNFAKYTQVAIETREVFRDYDPHFRALSLDEAYLDLTDYLASHHVDAEVAVQEMRDRVKARTGLTCSAGIGPNRMIAKIASDERKPDGQTRIMPTREAVLQFMDQLPVRKLPGCGKVLENQISIMLGVHTCRELRAACARVRRAFEGKKTCSFLMRACLGLSADELAEEGDEVGAVNRKSLSCERTFRAESDGTTLRERLRDLCRHVSEDMAASEPPLAGRLVALKTKASNFEVRNKQVSLAQPVGFSPDFGKKAEASSQDERATESEICRVAADLYRLLEPVLEEQMPCQFRLMGVRISSFRDQRAALDKGQKTLSSFFQGQGAGHKNSSSSTVTVHPAVEVQKSEREAVIDLDTSQEDASMESREQTRNLVGACIDSRLDLKHGKTEPRACLKRVVDSLANRGKRIRAAGVCCPVCGIRVPADEANQHVNAHYGD
mmetsp:Transcript_67627/g.149752  ORF Transcript_67627/g.149752 Transcript_67627/m.149752 type:complete len:625 (-) Transcript_67627:34-1908(-)